ncbi:hypothetical protein C1H46_011220 [Malus baccata]|uniref:Uncharacterized protein n=1 Tax=Malus baccata TaxID=106549 RepID=A0A540MWR5_MALBA|nr:hypothetical protein C1H46_011220 [Malus baccata]
MERSILSDLSILTAGSIGRFHRRAHSLELRGIFLSSGSNDVPGLDGVEHALANLFRVNLQDLNPVLFDEGKGRRTRDGEGEVTNYVGWLGSVSLGPWDVKSRRREREVRER